MAAVLSRPQLVNILLSRQSSFYFADDILISFFFSIWVTFAYVIFMKWIWVRRMQKNWPYCLCQYVLTRYARDKMTSTLKMTFSISFSTLDEIWYKKNHTEINLKMSYIIENQVVSASMCMQNMHTHGFRGRDEMIAFLKMTFWNSFSYIWNCFIICFANSISMCF